MIGAYVAMVDTDDLHFAVIAVADSALQDQTLVDEIVAEGVVRLGRPIVLLGSETHQIYGSRRIAELLYYVAPHMLPWQRTEWSERIPTVPDDVCQSGIGEFGEVRLPIAMWECFFADHHGVALDGKAEFEASA